MEHKAIVSISGKKGPFENVKNALAALDLTSLKGKRVMIKPNMGRAATFGHGYNTHPQAIAGIIEMVKVIDTTTVNSNSWAQSLLEYSGATDFVDETNSTLGESAKNITSATDIL